MFLSTTKWLKLPWFVPSLSVFSMYCMCELEPELGPEVTPAPVAVVVVRQDDSKVNRNSTSVCGCESLQYRATVPRP